MTSNTRSATTTSPSAAFWSSFKGFLSKGRATRRNQEERIAADNYRLAQDAVVDGLERRIQHLEHMLRTYRLRTIWRQREAKARECQRELEEEYQREIDEEHQRKLEKEYQQELEEAYQREIDEEYQRELEDVRMRELMEEERYWERVGKELLYQFDLYEGQWVDLKSGLLPLNSFTAAQIPWPVIIYDDGIIEVTYTNVEEFLFHRLRPSVVAKTRREVLKVELLRYHPDKFNVKVLSKLQVSERRLAADLAGDVTRILNEMMSTELER